MNATHKTIIWANLLTDSYLFDPHPLQFLFDSSLESPTSVKLSRLNEELGLFLNPNHTPEFTNSSTITTLLPNPIPSAYLTYLRQRGWPERDIHLIPGSFRDILNQPSSPMAGTACDQFITAGWSLLEEKLAPRSCEARARRPFSTLHFLNSKASLYREIIPRLDYLPFPKTTIKSLNELLETPIPERSHLVKAEFSSGGGGVFRFTENFKKILHHRAQGAFQNNSWPASSQWLLQEELPIAAEYSVAVHEDGSFSTYGVSYDGRRLSYQHTKLDTPAAKDPLRLAPVVRSLQNIVSEPGRILPFGFDCIQTTDGILYPLIDLNVRLTKPHLLDAAAHVLGLQEWTALRIRETGYTFPSESDQALQPFDQLFNDFPGAAPVSLGGLWNTSQIKQVLESTWLIPKKSDTRDFRERVLQLYSRKKK
jgi:hypothetical protein